MTTTIAILAKALTKNAFGCPEFERKKAIIDTLVEFARATEVFKYTFERNIQSTEVNSNRNDEVRFNISGIEGDKKPFSISKLYLGTSGYRTKKLRLSNDITEYDSIIAEPVTKFFYFPDRRTIAIHPFDTDAEFDSDDELNLTVEVVFVPHPDITEIEDEIYYDWREEIEAGALSRLMEQVDKPWTNLKRAVTERGKFLKGITRSRISTNQADNNNEPRIQMRKFV